MTSRSVPGALGTTATILAALASVAGLLIPGLYRDAPNWVQQARGTDLATLFVAVPLVAAGIWTTRRGSSTGVLAVVAGLFYLVYNYAIFAFSVVMNPLTAIHIAIFGLALWSLVLGAHDRRVVAAAEAVRDRLYRRLSGGLLIAVAALFGLLWIGQIVTTTLTGTLAPVLVLAGLSTNPVYALDLGFFLPLAALAGLGLIRGSRASVFALPMLIWVPVMSAGVLGGFVFVAAAGDAVPVGVVAIVGGLGLVSAILATAPLVRRPTQARNAAPA